MAEREPLRVLMVSATGVFGGAERVFVGVARHAPANGVDVRALVLQPGRLVDELRAVDTSVVVADRGRLRNPLDVARTWRTVAAEARRHRSHVVFGNMATAQLYTALAARRAGVPVIWSQVNNPSVGGWIDRVASFLPAAEVLCCSDFVATRQQAMRGTPPVSTWYLGTDPDRFRPGRLGNLRAEFGVADDAVWIGIVGRLQEWKRQDHFLEAAALVAQQRPDVRFAVVGGAVLGWEGDYESRLGQQCARLGIDGIVHFTGDRADVEEWMATLDVVVNCSVAEPFGLVVTEAMSAGRAVVAMAAGGPAEVVTHDVDGVLVDDAGSPEALSSALVALADDADRRRRLGQEARRTVEARFSEQSMARQFATHARVVAASTELRVP